MFRYILPLLIFLLVESAFAKIPPECGKYWSKPYDYTNQEHLTNRGKIPQVVGAHFKPSIENLIKGNKAHFSQDLNYTLNAIPNHHRALYSVIKYDQKIEGKTNLHHSAKLVRSVDCYLVRATHFKRDDGVVWLLYGLYLQRKGKYDEALEKYKKALKLMPEDGQLNYNLSLLYIQMKNHPLAVKHAKIYYAHKGKMQGLKRKLITLGVWEEY